MDYKHTDETSITDGRVWDTCHNIIEKMWNVVKM